MNKYDLLKFRRHWAELSVKFATDYSEWINVFSELIVFVSGVASRIEGKKQLPENCCYLLMSKSINHSLAAYVLSERGLLIDAALSARNALETLLMLELFAKDKSINHFELWAKGKRYSPSDVRNRLKQIPSVDVGDLTITVDAEYQKVVKFVYDWLSQITHANLDSIQYTVVADAPQKYRVLIGGALDGQKDFINAVFTTINQTLFTTVLICCAVFEPTFLEESKDTIRHLSASIKRTSKS